LLQETSSITAASSEILTFFIDWFSLIRRLSYRFFICAIRIVTC